MFIHLRFLLSICNKVVIKTRVFSTVQPNELNILFKVFLTTYNNMCTEHLTFLKCL